jgi:3-hydroxyisobutyrate dehydrogenase
MASALDTGTATPMGSLARSLYVAHGDNGFGQVDFSSIQKFFQRD